MDSEHRLTSEEVALQAEEAWQHRLSGKPQRSIASEMGISQQRVSQLLKMVRDDIPEQTREDLVKETIERYDALLEVWMPKAILGNAGAFDRVVRIEADRRKLMGLDAPVRLEHSGEIATYDITGVRLEDLT
jgi:predicted transcriptional regulator